MSWLLKLSQRYTGDNWWGRNWFAQNADQMVNYDVFRSPRYPNVFMGGKDDKAEVAALAGQPICMTINCMDLPEVDPRQGMDDQEYEAVKSLFDQKVIETMSAIATASCPVFVHCANGANRSPSVLAAALSRLTGESVDDLLSEMKTQRAYVNPQDAFHDMAVENSSQAVA